jgi:hypothetical protein
MNKQPEESSIVLSGDATERIKAIKINNRLLFIHMFLTLIIFIIFLNIVIKDPSYIDEYSASIITFIIGTGAWFFAAFILASVIMWIPAAFFAKTIRPEIIVCDNVMTYLAGSTSLNYVGFSIAVYPSLKYLLGYEPAQRLLRDEITSIDIEPARFLKPGFGLGEHIVIKHKQGMLTTGIWLDTIEKKRIVDRLIKWAKINS